MGKINFEEFYKVDVEDLIIRNKLLHSNVSINENDNYLVVKNNEGKKLFWVDNSGANITSLDKAVLIEDVVGFPKLNEGVLNVINNKLEFNKELNLDKINAIESNINKLNVDDLKIKKIINLSLLSSDSILNKILSTDELKAKEANIIDLKSDKLTSDDIKTKHISSKTLNVELFNPNEINSNNLISNEIDINKAKINELQLNDGGIKNLECENIKTKKIDIIENANISVLNNTEANIDTLYSCNSEIQILKVYNLIKEIVIFGTIEEPKFLNNYSINTLDVNNEQNNIKIFNKIDNDTPENKFKLLNLPSHKRYKISTIPHNQLINIDYNICVINNEFWLYTRFNKSPKNLIVEIILDTI